MDSRMRELASYLLANCHQPVTIRDMCRRVNVSGSHLHHLFLREAGMSPLRFLKLARLRRASQLLQTTHLSVKEVMASVGFNDPSHFVRDFGRAYGDTPARYRRRQFAVTTAVPANTQQPRPTKPR